jgi:hypothetical protein
MERQAAVSTESPRTQRAWFFAALALFAAWVIALAVMAFSSSKPPSDRRAGAVATEPDS